MNRFKKELIKRGVRLEHQYPWLPYYTGSVTLECVIVNAEKATVYRYYDEVGGVVDTYCRNMCANTDWA